MASLIIGSRTRLETKPGKSRQLCTSLPMRRPASTTAASVASEVSAPRMTSTNFISGTGFMKCMPMKRSARLVAAARRVMGMLDVFEARMALGPTRPSSSAKSLRLTSTFSTTASTTRSQPASSAFDVEVRMRPRAAVAASFVSVPFSASLPNDLSMVARPFCTNSGLRSTRTTS